MRTTYMNIILLMYLFSSLGCLNGIVQREDVNCHVFRLLNSQDLSHLILRCDYFHNLLTLLTHSLFRMHDVNNRHTFDV